MVQDTEKRNFALREDGEETSVFTGTYPRQAAMKAARRLDEVGESDDDAPRQEIRLRERGTNRVHVYEAWAWEADAPDDGPDWLGESVTKANVSKQGLKLVE